jgi:hypothetical protein
MISRPRISTSGFTGDRHRVRTVTTGSFMHKPTFLQKCSQKKTYANGDAVH